MKNAHRMTEEMTVDQDDLPDEMDLASAVNQNLSFRLRGRERHLLNKIEEALERWKMASTGNVMSVEPGLASDDCALGRSPPSASYAKKSRSIESEPSLSLGLLSTIPLRERRARPLGGVSSVPDFTKSESDRNRRFNESGTRLQSNTTPIHFHLLRPFFHRMRR